MTRRRIPWKRVLNLSVTQSSRLFFFYYPENFRLMLIFFIIQKILDSCWFFFFLPTPCAKQFTDANNHCSWVDFISNNMFRLWGLAIISASVINTVDMFGTDEQICIDTAVDWFLRLPHSGPVGFSNCFLYLFKVHEDLLHRAYYFTFV